jgi:hypothetical protein
LARWIPPGSFIKYGRTEISVQLKLKKLPNWINLEDQNVKDNIEFDVVAFVQDDESIELYLSLIIEPNNFDEWCKSFKGYINHIPKINRNSRKIYHMGYVEHDFKLQDKIDDGYTIYYFDTYDLLNPDEEGNLYESKVRYFNDNDGGYLEIKSYKTEEEARIGHKELIQKWRKLIDN